MPFHIESQTEPIPGYRLIERLGGGGFGEVWKCEAPGKILKAIKFVFGNLEDVSQIENSIKAEQELRSIERIKNIRHPFILSIERYEIIDGQLMIVTELADCNLYERFREYRNKGLMGIPRDELLGFMDEIAEALDIMTIQHDLLHLDIKPQNLFLMYNHIKIGDFGLVKDLEGMHAKVTGGVTPVYAAPETFEGYVSRYSDQYSLAIVFQELLTGIRPFNGSNPKQLMLQHIQTAPQLDPLPPADRPIIAKALSKKPTDRWENCQALVDALKHSHQRAGKDAPTEIPNLASDTPPEPIPVLRRRGDSAPPTLEPHEVPSAHRVDDYFDLGPVTQSAILRNNNGTVTQLRRTAARSTIKPVQDNETGVLRPVVLIGMGQFGRATLQWVRQGLHLQFGPTGLPIVRCLAIDTDPAHAGEHLAKTNDQEDVLLTRLNRPARYIRSRDTLPPVEDWLNSNILYRMPRTQLTSGIRALGRLALVEHYRAFRSRLERDLKAVMETESLAESEKLAKTSFHSTKPRIYLIGHLGGGTASGMFIDCAYIARKVMRAMKLDEEDIHGIFYVPDSQCMESADLPEANAVAALYELFHFQQAGQTFRALYESKSEWTEENSPPFKQIQLIESPPRKATSQEGKDQATLQIQKVAEVLNRVFLTPLGRVADPSRLMPGATPYQTMGLRVLNSPRRVLIRRAAHLIFQRIIEQWLVPATVQIQDTVRHRIDGFFHYEKLTPEMLTEYFEQAAQSSLGSDADTVIQQLIEPYQQGIQEKIPDASEIKKTLRDIILKLGSSSDGSSTNTLLLVEENTRLNRALRDAGEKVVRGGATRLVFTIYRHLDKAGLRMGATEESLRYALAKLDSWIAGHEAKARQAQSEYGQAMEYLRADLIEHERLKAVPRKKWPSMTTPGERLLAIFRARFRFLICEQIAKVYAGFRGACSDQLREIRFCRNRLQELQQSAMTMEKLPERPVTANRVTESVLIPFGCKDLLQAVSQFAESITSSDLLKIDSLVAEHMEQRYPRLAELCLSNIEQLRPIRELILQEAKRYLEQRLTLGDAASLFLDNQQQAEEAFRKIYAEAEPMLRLHGDEQCREAAFLMLQNSPQGQKLGELATSCYPHTNVVNINRNDEVILYRTIVGISFESLPVLGEMGKEAYEIALGIEHFTPHSRQDIDQWQKPVVVAESHPQQF
ncbi:MAG TPA: tubulin-like doman-containing protein [Gemmatales bacterium]|nr:tubulin-like doman-containing protein [Gemmatales bacterium]